MLEVIERIAHPNDLADPHQRIHLEASDYYPVYHEIASKCRPTSILELGVRYGYTGSVMLHASGGRASYVGIDRQMWGSDSNEIALRNLKQFTTGSVVVIDGDTQLVETARKAIGTFDLIHFDACHDTSGMLKEFDLFLPKLAKGGIIIVDDCRSVKCRRAVDTIIRSGRCREVAPVQSLTGIVIMEAA